MGASSPWKSSKIKESRIAGPHVAREAMAGLTQEHESEGFEKSPVAREIHKMFANPKLVSAADRWMRLGKPGGARLKDNKELMKGIYSALEQEQKQLAYKTETGGRLAHPGLGVPTGGRPGQAAIETATAAAKRGKTVEEIIGKRRDMVAGVVESAIKWSRKQNPKGPVSLAYIPAPTKQEFISLVDSGQVKAGDVLVSPPEYHQGVRISEPGFVVVTQDAIDNRNKTPEQIKQEKAEKEIQSKMDPRVTKINTWSRRLSGSKYDLSKMSAKQKSSRNKRVGDLRAIAEKLSADMDAKKARGELSEAEKRSQAAAKAFLQKFKIEK